MHTPCRTLFASSMAPWRAAAGVPATATATATGTAAATTQPVTPLSERTDVAYVNLRGTCYPDPTIVRLLGAAQAASGYVCPVWDTLESFKRRGMDFVVEPRGVEVPLSAGLPVLLYNAQDTTLFAELSAAAGKNGANRSPNEWGEAVVSALRERGGSGKPLLTVSEWQSVARNVMGEPLGRTLQTALETGYERYAELQQKSPVWVEASQLRVLGLEVLPGEAERGFMEPSATDVLRTPRVWFNASQLATHPTVRLDMESCLQTPQVCLNVDGARYHVTTRFLLRMYCQKWGYRMRTAVFVTPERLRERGGVVLRQSPAKLEAARTGMKTGSGAADTESDVPPPFMMVADGELLTLWNTEQTSLHRELHGEAVQRRRADWDARQNGRSNGVSAMGGAPSAAAAASA